MDPLSIGLASAIATGLSAVVIAWQAVLTRSAVKVSKNALVLSERAYRRDLIATIESRSRIPRIQTESADPFIGVVERARPPKRHGLTTDLVFRFPRDEATRVEVSVPFSVTNDGDRQMRLTSPTGGTFVDQLGKRDYYLSVEPGTVVSAQLVIAKPAGDLRFDERTNAAFLGPGAFIGTIAYTGPLDADISVFHHVVVFVPELVENELLRGNWSIAENPTFLSMISLGSVKIYWESRAEGLKLREDPGVEARDAFEAFHAKYRNDADAIA